MRSARSGYEATDDDRFGWRMGRGSSEPVFPSNPLCCWQFRGISPVGAERFLRPGRRRGFRAPCCEIKQDPAAENLGALSWAITARGYGRDRCYPRGQQCPTAATGPARRL